MDSYPDRVDGLDQSVFLLVRDERGCVPAGASIKHMEDDVLVHEQEVTFYLLVELVRNIHAAGVAGSWLRPGSANTAGVYNLGDEVQNFLRDSYSSQESRHGVLRGMPPTHMQLPQSQSDG